MHVLDYQDEAASPCRTAQQLRDRSEQPVPLPTLPSTRPRRARPELRQQPLHLSPDVLRSRGQRGLQQVAAIYPVKLAQRIRQWQQRQRLARRQASAPNGDAAVDRDSPHPLSDQTSLADPGIAHDQEQPRISAHDCPQAGQLTLTADKTR
jgi:hypothetical protein